MITLFSMPQDRARAEAIANALIEADLAPWWEQVVPGGPDWAQAMTKAVDARCLIFCWSAASLADEPVANAFRAAAIDACSRQQAIGVLLEPVDPPAAFSCRSYDFSGWRAAPQGWRKWLIGNAYLRDIVAAAKYKQSGYHPPPPSAPRTLLLRQLATVSAALFLPLVAIIGFWSDIRSLAGLDMIASTEEQQAWDALPGGDCRALRGFVRRFDDGVYRERAEALLQGAESVRRTDWRKLDQPGELYIPHRGAASADAAQAQARADAQTEATRRCRAMAEAGGMRLLDARVAMLRQDCRTIGNETLCDWRGESVCAMEEPVEIVTQMCRAE